MSRPDPLADALADTKLTLTHSEQERRAKARPYRPRALHQNPQHIAERYAAACARADRILAGSGGSSDFEQAVKNAEYPELARELLMLYGHYMTRSMAAPVRGRDSNPFRHLSDKDASRMFMRAVEDIADKSTGKMGPWYVGLSVTRSAAR